MTGGERAWNWGVASWAGPSGGAGAHVAGEVSRVDAAGSVEAWGCCAWNCGLAVFTGEGGVAGASMKMCLKKWKKNEKNEKK